MRFCEIDGTPLHLLHNTNKLVLHMYVDVHTKIHLSIQTLHKQGKRKIARDYGNIVTYIKLVLKVINPSYPIRWFKNFGYFY